MSMIKQDYSFYYNPLIKLFMNVQQNSIENKDKVLCKECNTFYGCQASEYLCSVCFKKSKDSKKEEFEAKTATEPTTPATEADNDLLESMEQLTLEPTKKQQKDRKRCFSCNKKTGLLGIQCKCSYVYCNKHRLPEDHECQVNHKLIGKEKLKKEIVKVCSGKIQDF